MSRQKYLKFRSKQMRKLDQRSENLKSFLRNRFKFQTKTLRSEKKNFKRQSHKIQVRFNQKVRYCQLQYGKQKINKIRTQTMNKSHNHVLLSIKNCKKIINLEGISNRFSLFQSSYKPGTQYPIIKEIAVDELEFQLGVDHYTFLWTDQLLSIKQIRALEYPKRVNHFPDISQITRKNRLATNLNNMKVHFPKDYDFYPETWLIPTDHHKIMKKHTKGKIYILKPEANCQGKGIFLIDNPNKINKQQNMVVQEYLQNPYLIDGLKFDMRIYVLITSIKPLRVYLYNEGISRFATEKFQRAKTDNLADTFTHLTNYAINKFNENFSHDQTQGHKRPLTSTFQNLEDFTHLMNQVKEIVIKTIISALPALQNSYAQCKKNDPSSCFQLLGFDIILDENKKAYLLEVNQNPSLHTDTSADKKIKSALVKNIFKMVSGGLPNFFEEKLQNKMKMKDRHEMNNIGNFERIYPCENLEETQKYDEFFVKSIELYREKYGINIVRNIKKKMLPQIQPNENSQIQLEKSEKVDKILQRSNGPLTGFFYSRQKMEKIYRTKTKFTPYTSAAKRKAINL